MKLVNSGVDAAVLKKVFKGDLTKAQQERYERLEKEHFGDYEKQTGIYAPKPTEKL